MLFQQQRDRIQVLALQLSEDYLCIWMIKCVIYSYSYS